MAENSNQILFNEKIETDNTQTRASESSTQTNSSDSVTTINALPRVQNNDDLKVDIFFNHVLQTYSLAQPVNKLVFITINHIVRTLPPYLRALEKIGRVAAVIPKASFRDEKIYSYVQQNYNVAIEITKEKLKLQNEAVKFIRNLIKPDEKLIIIDIGGYFASPLPELYQDELVRESLLGVVEDTENGMQKYAAIIKDSKFPVVSVARSFLKETEDYNVGKSIVRATDGVLRRDAHGLQERYKNTGIIGVGKIGFSIARHIQAEAGNVTICDLNPQRTMYASSRGLQQASKESILEQADLIFSSTGNKGLKGDDFLKLRNNVFIASVTSADDEIDIQGLEDRAVKKHQENNITQYVLNNGHTINLLYHGNAINFIDGAINGPFIYSVQAELLICALQLARNQYHEKPTHVIHELADADMSRIAAIWNRVFDGNMTWSDEQVFSNAPINSRHFVETEANYINKNSLAHFFNVPNYTQHFSGRAQTRKKIINYIQHDVANKPIHPYVITGMGGIGKTQLALNCAWDVRSQFTKCIYICAENLATITTSFQKIAQQFDIQMEENLEKLLPIIYKTLKKQGRSLLIFDDAPNKVFLTPYLPSSDLGYSNADFSVLITSRDQTQWHQCEKLLLDPEQPEIKQDAEVYLQKQLNCSVQEAEQLAKTVHHLPLALSQLVAYMKKVNCSVASCLELLKQNKKRQHVLSEPSQEDGEQKYKRVVLTLWQLSMESLNKEVPQARHIIELCAYLFADKIQMAIFNNTSTNDFFDKIVAPLQSYSLIYLIDDSDFRVHRLLQEVIRATLENPENFCQELISLLTTYSPRYSRNDIAQLSNTYLHYQAISTYVDLKNTDLNQISHLKLLYALGGYCQDYLYDYANSRHYLEHAIELEQTDQELTLKIKRLLAKAYFRTNETAKAEKLYQELSSAELPAKLASKMVLDHYLFLQEIKRYESAKKLLNDFLNTTAGDEEDKARAYHYLIKDEIRHINILNGKLAEATAKEFSTWQTNNKRKNEEYIKSLKSRISDLMSTILLWIEKSLTIKKANNNYREILRTSLLLFESVRNDWSIPAVQKVVDLMCNLYVGNEASLQHLQREHYATDFFSVSKHLARFLNSFPECFKDSFEKLKQILIEEQSWVEKYFGETSNENTELKKISSHKQKKQTSLQFKPVEKSNHSQPAPTMDVDEMQIDNLETKKTSNNKTTGFFNSVTKKTSQASDSKNTKKRTLTGECEQPPTAKRPKTDQNNIEIIEIDDSDAEAEKIKLSKPSK